MQDQLRRDSASNTLGVPENLKGTRAGIFHLLVDQTEADMPHEIMQATPKVMHPTSTTSVSDNSWKNVYQTDYFIFND